jgi:hypothetical protein
MENRSGVQCSSAATHFTQTPGQAAHLHLHIQAVHNQHDLHHMHISAGKYDRQDVCSMATEQTVVQEAGAWSTYENAAGKRCLE